MRGKRAKQYRKLMHQYGLIFGFREPYQVLLDAQILEDAARCKMDLIGGLERSLHGKVKPMITQCSIRHLYNSENKSDALIEHAKAFERRRCDHHLLDEPLSTYDCLTSVVDPKGSTTNKHRYVVASQDTRTRAHMRRIPGVPLIYINRSVVIMEPMGGATEQLREKEERLKFRAGIKSRQSSTVLGKRRRDGSYTEGDDKSALDLDVQPSETNAVEISRAVPKAKRKGPKGANPLSVMKAKKRVESSAPHVERLLKQSSETGAKSPEEPVAKKKRKRKPKTPGDTGAVVSPSD